jgi:hypothetical protein
VGEVHELRRSCNHYVPVRMRLNVHQAGLEACAQLRPRHEQVVRRSKTRSLLHPVRGCEQYGPRFEGAQQRQRDRPEALACIVEGQQHGAGGSPAASARREIFLERERAIAVAAQEFQVAREDLGLHVVIREHRYFAAQQGQAEDEARVAGSRNAGGGAQQATEIFHGRDRCVQRACTDAVHETRTCGRSSMYAIA